MNNEDWCRLPPEAQLDEINRLRQTITAPCGCGGRVGIMHTLMSSPLGNWFIVTCIDCHMTSASKRYGHAGLELVIAEWNAGKRKAGKVRELHGH